MSRENVQIVREAFDLAACRDASVFDAYDPDVEMDFSASPFADFMTPSEGETGDETLTPSPDRAAIRCASPPPKKRTSPRLRVRIA